MNNADEILRYYSEVIAVVYLCAWGTLAVWEALAPRRPLQRSLRMRWLSHGALLVLGASFVNVLLPMTCVATAIWIWDAKWGLFNQGQWPVWFEYSMAFIALDLARYKMHSLQHRYVWLWRLHRIHHTDGDIDFTTSLRFHPLELLLMTLVNIAVIAALGLPVVAIIIYEAFAFGINVFNHGNINMPSILDRWLRMLIVTPDMHRIHHSSEAQEYDRNYGAFLSFWDRLFGTYQAEPSTSQESMSLGLVEYSDSKHDQIHFLLKNPLLQAAPNPRPHHQISPVRVDKPATPEL